MKNVPEGLVWMTYLRHFKQSCQALQVGLEKSHQMLRLQKTAREKVQQVAVIILQIVLVSAVEAMLLLQSPFPQCLEEANAAKVTTALSMIDQVKDLPLVLLVETARMSTGFVVEVKRVYWNQQVAVGVAAVVADQISYYFPLTVIENRCLRLVVMRVGEAA